MHIKFWKMHGLGNDFLVIDMIEQEIDLNPQLIRSMANRKTGIGFDQLLTISAPTNPESDFLYRIFNADASEAEQCGNGARCIHTFVRQKGFTSRDEIRLQTKKGIIKCTLEENKNISVEIGIPDFRPEAIPFAPSKKEGDYYLLDIKNDRISLPIIPVGIGNPHAVIEVTNLQDYPVAEIGKKVCSHENFPNGANVSFIELVSRQQLNLRVFERGVGETSACGTAACAAAACGIKKGTLDSEVLVNQPGGGLNIIWNNFEKPMIMSGPSTKVYEGIFNT